MSLVNCVLARYELFVLCASCVPAHPSLTPTHNSIAESVVQCSWERAKERDSPRSQSEAEIIALHGRPVAPLDCVTE